jgi:hypothetical protein
MIDAKEHDVIRRALQVQPRAVVPDPEDEEVWATLHRRGLARLAEPSHRFNHWEVTDAGRDAFALYGQVDALGKPLIAHDWYYIEDTSSRADCALFWRPSCSGYTTVVEDAGKYGGIQAAKITTSIGRHDIAWPVAHIEAAARRHVSRDELASATRVARNTAIPPEQTRNPCCGNTGTHGEGGVEYCSTCGQVVEERKR